MNYSQVPKVITRVDVDGHTTSAPTSAPRMDCDCACPNTGLLLQTAPQQSTSQTQLRCAEGVYASQLDHEHHLLFNPLAQTGVVVVNQPAHQLWQSFREMPPPTVGYDDAQAQHGDALKQLLVSGLLEQAGQRTELVEGKPDTLTAWLHVTNQCNLRCQYCYVDKTNEHMNAETGQAAIEAVFRTAVLEGFKAVRLKFAGGEATLNAKLVFALDDAARAAAMRHNLRYEAVVLTNGAHLSPEFIGQSKQRDLQITISLDGLGATHDRQRRFLSGGGSASRVLASIDTLLQAGVRPFLSITVTDQSVDTLAETVAFALDKALLFNINFVRDHGKEWLDRSLGLKNERLIAALTEVFDLLESRLPSHSLLGTLIDRANFLQPHARACGAGNSYMVVGHDGAVAKCHMELERPITDVHEARPLQKLQLDEHGLQNPSVDEKSGCSTCEWKYWCGGGCAVQTFHATGTYNTQSPFCSVYKAAYPRLLRLEALRLLKFGSHHAQAATTAASQLPA